MGDTVTTIDRQRRAIIALTAAALTTAAPALARADSYINGMIFGVWVGVPLAAVGTAAALTVGLDHRNRGRPTTGALAFGFTAGALSLAYGAILVQGGTSVSDNQALYYGPGVALLAVGAADIALSVYGLVRAPDAPARARLMPVTVGGLDASGQFFGGLGVRVLAL